MLERLDDTIVAIASAPARGPVGVVRLSGPRSHEIVAQMACDDDAGRAIRQGTGARRVVCAISVRPCGEVPAVCYVFQAPHSYTRQDCVDVFTVGSPAVLDVVRRRALELGATPAQPGEFTARAFVNGAMDLAAAEAVAAVIRAGSDIQLAAARRMMEGAPARRIAALRDELADLMALVEADIDFAEEPIDFITPQEARRRLASLSEHVEALLNESILVERFEVLPRILLFGRPNAGKSTLMNALSGTSRAITAAVAGTTRDILSAPIRLRCGEAMLLDAAGLDEADDEVIARAQAMVRAEVDRVDLVCVVIDLTNPELSRVQDMLRSVQAPRVVIAANKADAGGPAPERQGVWDSAAGRGRAGAGRRGEASDFDGDEEVRRRFADVLGALKRSLPGPVVPVSARTGAGLDRLRAAFSEALGRQTTTIVGEAMLITERQASAIRQAAASMARAVSLCGEAAATIDCADLLAFELRDALEALGTVTGAVTTEDLLGAVFARFCIGK